MATQMHVAFSDHLVGAALLAGGPYGCAQGDLGTALGPCMKGTPSAPDPTALLSIAQQRATEGSIAPLSGLQDDHVWVWHGSEDAVVAESVSRSSVDFYQHAGVADVIWDGDLPAGHGFPVATGDGSCAKPVAPFLANCGFDAAGAVMQNVFPVTAASAVADDKPDSGALLRFDQQAFVSTAKDAASPQLADDGFIYVPKACAAGGRCGLMVVFHGCEQNADSVGDAFIQGSGFNVWADRTDTVLLYPQVRASLAPLNPKGCWDWWGYTGANYDTRDGAQLAWVNAVLTALGAPLK